MLQEAETQALALAAQYTGLTLTVSVRDQAAVAKVLGPLMEAVNQIIRARQVGARRNQPPGAAGPFPEFRNLPAGRPTYVLNLPPGSVRPQIAAMFQPTLVLDEGQLILSASSAAAERTAAAIAGGRPGQRWRPTGAFAPMAQRLPSGLVLLNVSDPRETLPGLIENLPALVPQLGAILLPSILAVREAAHRSECVNNLKQIGLAMSNYHAAHNDAFPRAAITDKQGKPLLSWRVAILPYIEQQALYNKFKLDEAWDSPHNRGLLKEMPPAYLCPSRARAEPFTTAYRVFSGKGALFENGRDVGAVQVTDGFGNTLMVVEAKQAVPWSKPDELAFDPAAPPSLFGAGSSHPDGFDALFADGSVRFVADSTDPSMFRAKITRGGGEPLSFAELPPPTIRRPRQAPVAGEFLHVDPALVPSAGEVKRLLFPASAALVVDQQGASLVTREPIPNLTNSPATAGVLVALLLPAVQAAREAARRAQCVNNLKLIGLGMHNYQSVQGALPGPSINDKQGKPLLSWRVAILPYVEQAELYNKFKLDEPWDSPHNRALLKEMPPTYVCPSRAVTEPYTTHYRVFTGKGALFEQGKATTIAEITDGTSNTLMVVEANEAVPWTKPDELVFNPAAPPSLFGAGSVHPGIFNVLFADGSVRFIKNSIGLDVVRALIMRAGGERINPGAL